MASGAIYDEAPPLGAILVRAGVLFDVIHPTPEAVSFQDIGHALSQVCRYGGHVSHFYTVAEHSVLLARWFLVRGEIEFARWALLHDAAEAYVGDVVRPIKRGLGPWFAMVERQVARAIFRRAGLPVDHNTSAAEIPPEVLAADDRILADEVDALFVTGWRPSFQPLGIEIACWDPCRARCEFDALGRDLFGTRWT